jgi:hypothetical protein
MYWLTVRDNKEPASNRFETARQIIEATDPVSAEAKKQLEDKQQQERQQSNPAAPTNPEDQAQAPPPDGEPSTRERGGAAEGYRVGRAAAGG